MAEATGTVQRGAGVESAATRDAKRVQAARERAGNFGGPQLKLAVNGSVAGHHLFWVNDDEGSLETHLYQGFSFVEPGEVGMASLGIVADNDLSNRLSRYVGKRADGSPMRAYLLKCPDDIWELREASRHAQADAWEADILRGHKTPGMGRYTPKGTSTSINPHYEQQVGDDQ
jgi:hypothetical protein